MNLQSFAVLALIALASNPAQAAAGKVESAIKTFNAIPADAEKLKTFCAMSKAMASGENEKDAVKLAEIDKQVDSYMQTLGQAFQTAWNAGEELNPDTPDGKAYYGTLEEISAKCAK